MVPRRAAAEAFVFSYMPDCSMLWRPDGAISRWMSSRAKVGVDRIQLHDLSQSTATTTVAADLLSKFVDKLRATGGK
jgi:hypothetical protein